MPRTIQLHPFSVALGAITVACACLLAGGGSVAGPPSPLDYMSVVQIDDGFGNMIDTVRFTGCNVQVVNGLDDTGTVNGAGNLIVGYAEMHNVVNDRTGSHNIVGGNANSYSSYGGLVVGIGNRICGIYASISGGGSNLASGTGSSISGGGGFNFDTKGPPGTNRATGEFSSVSGGARNWATAYASSVTAGIGNRASGDLSSVGGGSGNESSGGRASVSGGHDNIASGWNSSVSGGQNNEAAAGTDHTVGPSSISGGCDLIADRECQHLPCNQCPSDTTGDGVVDVDDLVAIILAWGKVCP